MNIDVEHAGDIIVMSPGGQIDNHTVKAFNASVSEVIPNATHFVIDFSRVPYVSSSGLRAILTATKLFDRNKGRFALCGLTGRVAELFDVSGFSSILDIYDSKEAAKLNVNASGG